jgi:hypothetical protein
MKKSNLSLSTLIEFIPNCTEFSKFQFLDGGINRDVRDPNVVKIIKSYKLFGTGSAVVTVIKTKSINGTVEYYIVDGQHRLVAAQRLKLSINIMIVELAIDTKLNVTKYIATLNNTSTGWSASTYLDSFKENGIREYTILNELKNKTGLTMTDLLFIFIGSNNRKSFTSGDMKFINEADSMELLDSVMLVKNAIPDKAFVRRSLYKIMRLCKDYKRMAKAILKTAEALKTAHSKFSENESEFYDHLVKIYKSEFSVK